MAEKKLESVAGELLRERRMTLAVAESCTGGLLGHLVTNISGSSDYFVGGIISYSNDAKERILLVRGETLQEHGAVSEETAREMARGARRLLRADVALAVTGIAGPGGGTAEKPVGLTYLALATADHEICHKFVWDGDRASNKMSSARAALEMLIDYLRMGLTQIEG